MYIFQGQPRATLLVAVTHHHVQSVNNSDINQLEHTMLTYTHRNQSTQAITTILSRNLCVASSHNATYQILDTRSVRTLKAPPQNTDYVASSSNLSTEQAQRQQHHNHNHHNHNYHNHNTHHRHKTNSTNAQSTANRTNERINELPNDPTNQHTKRTNEPTNEPTDEPTDEPTNQRTNKRPNRCFEILKSEI